MSTSPFSRDVSAVAIGVSAWAAAAALVKHSGLASSTLPAGAAQACAMTAGAAIAAGVITLLPGTSDQKLRIVSIATAAALILDGIGFSFLPATVYGVDVQTKEGAATGVNKASIIFAGAGAGLAMAAYQAPNN
jgi:hypothetical protein